MMADLTAKQASEFAKGQGQSLSASYLVRAVKKGLIQGHKVEMQTGVGYWVVDEDSLNDYLSHERRPGRKPKEGEASADA